MGQSGQGGLPVGGGSVADPTLSSMDSVAWGTLWVTWSSAWPVGPFDKAQTSWWQSCPLLVEFTAR